MKKKRKVKQAVAKKKSRKHPFEFVDATAPQHYWNPDIIIPTSVIEA